MDIQKEASVNENHLLRAKCYSYMEKKKKKG